MAILPRRKWNVIERGMLRDVVSFPITFDAMAVSKTLIRHYGYTGSFKVVPADTK